MGHTQPIQKRTRWTMTVGGKLAVISIATVSATLLLVGLLFQIELETNKRAQAWSDIEHAIGTVDLAVASQGERLATAAAALAQRETVRAVAHLVKSYEDPANYIPQLFDPEKSGLANTLTLQRPLIEADGLAVFDLRRQPIAFSCLCQNNSMLHGFSTVEAGRPGLHITRVDSGEAADEVPLLLPLLTPLSEARHELRMTAAGLLQIAQAAIPSPLTEEPVGVVVAGRLLDQRFLDEMRRQTGLALWMVRPEQSATPVTGLSVSALLAEQPPNGTRAWPVSHDHWQLGVLRRDLPGGSVLLLFGRDTAVQEAELAALQASAVAALVIIGLLVTPLTLLAGRRLIARPLQQITAGLDQLWRGGHIDPRWVGQRNEFGALARTLNDMGDTIVSRERELAASRAHYQRLYERAPIGYATLDPIRHTILDANPAFRSIVAGEGFQLAGRPIIELCGSPVCRERIVELLARLSAGGLVRDEELLLSGTAGEAVWLSLSMDRDGDVIRLAALDTSQRKQAEQQVMDALDALTTSHAELEEFARIAAHDLREPSRLVVTFAQLLGRRAEALGDEDREHLRFLMDSAQRMYDVVEDVLDYTRAGTTDTPFSWVDTGRLVTAVLEDLEPTLRAGEAVVTVEPLPAVHCNPSELRQVFEQLIRNAVKFRSPERPPRLRLRAVQGNGEWVFAIEDNGIGIAREHTRQIFGVFRRLHTREAYPGTGIGLAICKRVIDHHKGRIWVDSEPGRGSTFRFTIPLLARQTSEPAEMRREETT